jgi:hypothetical protein
MESRENCQLSNKIEPMLNGVVSTMFTTRYIFLILLISLSAARIVAETPYWVRVVDEETGRGVSLVQLTAHNSTSYWTDSSGIAVIEDPVLQNQDVQFEVRSDGYIFEQKSTRDSRVDLHVRAGAHDELKIKRTDIAKRLYRITGADIYRDTLLAGFKPPISHPLMDSGVVGQDTNIAVIYKGKIFWCWGDTNGLTRSNYKATCAVSGLPSQGGLDPSTGVDLTYFSDGNGFVRAMLPLRGPGTIWITSLFTVKDKHGIERLMATYTRQIKLEPPFEFGIAEFNDTTGTFDVLSKIPPPTNHFTSHPFHLSVDGKDYLYLYPLERVPADWKAVQNPDSYESYTCLKQGAKLDMQNPQLERDASGALVCGWKHNTAWIDADRELELMNRGLIDKAHANFLLLDVDTGEPTKARPESVAWNAYRKKWILLSQHVGTAFYSEANQPIGPWLKAKAIATHPAYNFYNLVQHQFFDADGGRFIYFEGTYTAKFSAAKQKTPRYDYNQLMYRLDLSDPRLEAARVK